MIIKLCVQRRNLRLAMDVFHRLHGHTTLNRYGTRCITGLLVLAVGVAALQAARPGNWQLTRVVVALRCFYFCCAQVHLQLSNPSLRDPGQRGRGSACTEHDARGRQRGYTARWLLICRAAQGGGQQQALAAAAQGVQGDAESSGAFAMVCFGTGWGSRGRAVVVIHSNGSYGQARG